MTVFLGEFPSQGSVQRVLAMRTGWWSVLFRGLSVATMTMFSSPASAALVTVRIPWDSEPAFHEMSVVA